MSEKTSRRGMFGALAGLLAGGAVAAMSREIGNPAPIGERLADGSVVINTYRLVIRGDQGGDITLTPDVVRGESMAIGWADPVFLSECTIGDGVGDLSYDLSGDIKLL